MQDGTTRRAGPTRRDVIMGAGVSALALTAGSGLAQRPAVARGMVFEDRSGTGKRREGDPGIAGVLVSNGRDVTATDADGRWTLPVADRRQRVRDQAAALDDPDRVGWHPALLPLASAARHATNQPFADYRGRRTDRPVAGQPSTFRCCARTRAPASRPCCSLTRSPRTTLSSPTCATTSLPARSVSTPRSPSTTAMWCPTICRSIRATCDYSARLASPGITAPAITT